MSTRTLPLNDHLYSYLQQVSLREPPAFRRCRQETAQLPMSRMQIAPEEGQFINFLVNLMGVERAIEIGSFTGYSSLWIASALPRGGCLVACDINEAWTRQARQYWAEAGVMDRIEMRLAPAQQTLEELLDRDQHKSYDFIFVDADKEMYDSYYESALKLLRPGGIVAIDNVFWNGRVANPAADDPDTRSIRRLNEKIHGDERVDVTVVPIGDGVTLCRKR